jgi:hypothetical protein
MPLAASTYTFGDGLLTVLELAFLFLWIWIAIGVVFDIFRSHDLSNWAKKLSQNREAGISAWSANLA